MACVSPSVVQSWASKANPHDLHAVSRLAKALDMNFKELLLGELDEAKTSAASIEVFDEDELFEGICKVSIRRLTPKKEK